MRGHCRQPCRFLTCPFDLVCSTSLASNVCLAFFSTLNGEAWMVLLRGARRVDCREPGHLHRYLFQWEHLEICSQAKATRQRLSLSSWGKTVKGPPQLCACTVPLCYSHPHRTSVWYTTQHCPAILPSSAEGERPGAVRSTVYLRTH